MSAEIRPRFGMLVRADGTEVPITYAPVGGDVFEPRYAGTDDAVVLRPGESLQVDVLAPGQGLLVTEVTEVNGHEE